LTDNTVDRPHLGFEAKSRSIKLAAILPLREVSDRIRRTKKFLQIQVSIGEVGLIEPPVVRRDAEDPEIYHLLDGHLRLAVLLDRGDESVECLIAKDDEAFTYNKRISRLAAVQEHKMILAALNKGVSEERLARALNVNIANITLKRNLLNGICPEVVDLLQAKPVPISVFSQLRSLQPMRQIEVARLMVAMSRYSRGYVKSLVAATPDHNFVGGRRPKRPQGITTDQMHLMQRESENLDREFRQVEQRYGEDRLDLVLAVGYINRLLDNARVVRFLAEFHPDIVAELQKMCRV